MPRRHAASLLPKWHHDPALLELVRSPLTHSMVAHIAEKAVQVIRCKPDPVSELATPPTTPTSTGFDSVLPSLPDFITQVVRKSKCHVPTLLCTLVYLDRLKYRLPARSSGSPSTLHRIFFSTLIVAAKYLNDSSPQNKHWQKYAVHFSLEEIEVMERQLLALLDFDLRIDESELLEHFAPFLRAPEASPSAYTTPRSASNPILSPGLASLESRPKTSRGPSSPSALSAEGTHTGSTRLLTPTYALQTPALTTSSSLPPTSQRRPSRPARSPERPSSRPISWSPSHRHSSGSSYSSLSSGPRTPQDDEHSLRRVAVTPDSELPTYSPELRLRRSQETLYDLRSKAIEQGKQNRGRKNEKELRIVVPHGYAVGANGLPTPPSAYDCARRSGVELSDDDRANMLRMSVF